MTRSPLAYPLTRSADMDAGGAADLQTDIMRFMAILSLCLVAIFALVQSIPMQPAEPVNPARQSQATTAVSEGQAAQTAEIAEAPAMAVPQAELEAVVSLTRPKWKPTFASESAPPKKAETQTPVELATSAATPSAVPEAVPTVANSEPEGFTLRFESDEALVRLVAKNSIGVYAVGKDRAQRMTVSDSRISFWDASTPNTYHEMDTATVPVAVVEALARSGLSASDVSWAVTLPARLKTQLDELMLEHRGGTLIIVSSGDIRWESS